MSTDWATAFKNVNLQYFFRETLGKLEARYLPDAPAQHAELGRLIFALQASGLAVERGIVSEGDHVQLIKNSVKIAYMMGREDEREGEAGDGE